jgi:hypothetical protein
MLSEIHQNRSENDRNRNEYAGHPNRHPQVFCELLKVCFVIGILFFDLVHSLRRKNRTSGKLNSRPSQIAIAPDDLNPEKEIQSEKTRKNKRYSEQYPAH